MTTSRRARSPQGTPDTLEHELKRAALASVAIHPDHSSGQRPGDPLRERVQADNVSEIRPIVERITGRHVILTSTPASEQNAALLRSQLRRWAVQR